jgi:hypothetical protein
VPVKELDPGESYQFAPTPLRVVLDGNTEGRVELRAIDQADDDVSPIRLSATEIIVTPKPQRLRLRAVPVGGGTFAPGTHIGMSLRTEGAASVNEQIIVPTSDVGALPHRDLAVLEFAPNRAVLTVSKETGWRPEQRVAPSPRSGTNSLTVTRPEPRGPSVVDDPGLETGRYALRTAARSGPLGTPPTCWGLVLDGSASMQALGETHVVEDLALVISGVLVEWAGHGAVSTSYSGVDTVSAVPDGGADPRRFVRSALVDREPSSLSFLTPALRRAISEVGTSGAVVILTDGVPGDVDALAQELERHPEVTCAVVSLGVSHHGLPSDAVTSWWREELVALDPLAALDNVGVVALTLDHERRLVLDAPRDAEFARALTAALGSR